VGSERPTLDDWLGGKVPPKTREETRADHKERTQVRVRRVRALIRDQTFRRDLYRRLLSRG